MRGDSQVAKMILAVGGPKKIPLWDKWWLTPRTVLCLDFLTHYLGSCHCLLFSVDSRFPWPSPARVTTLNQELAKTQLSLASLMRNLVLLDYCSWATSCQQFLRKLFNHPQLQRNRWHTGGGHFEVYVLVTSKQREDTKASTSSGPKSTFPPRRNGLAGVFVFPPFWPLNFPSHELTYAMERRLDMSGVVSGDTACFNNAEQHWPNVLTEDQILKFVLMSCFFFPLMSLNQNSWITFYYANCPLRKSELL